MHRLSRHLANYTSGPKDREAERAEPSSTRSGVVDTWRAVACLGVLLFHGSNELHETHEWLRWPALIFGQNGPRLTIFFVLTGYCLACVVERQARENASALSFLQRRFLRIYPTYWIALLFAIGLVLLATFFNGLPPSYAFPPSAGAWIGDLTLTSLWIDQEHRLLVAWFLNHLVAFYLIFGFAVSLRRPSTRILFYCMITAMAFWPGAPDLLPFLELVPQVACGIVLALCFPFAQSPGASRPASARLLLLAYPTLYAVWGLHRGDLLPIYAAVVMLSLGLCLRFSDRLPAAPRPILAVAAASYSIYLIHVPIMSPAMNLARRLLPAESLIFVGVWAAHLALGLLAGLWFHKLVERPINRALAHALRYRPTRDTAAVP